MLKTFQVNCEKYSAMNDTEDKKIYNKKVAMITTDKMTKKEDIFSSLVYGSFSSSIGMCLFIQSISH